MTKAELVEQVAAILALPKRQAETVVHLFWQSIMDVLEAGDHVELRGFGSFRVRARRPRLGRNPTTGAPVAIPAKQVPWFKPGKALRALVNARPGVPDDPQRRLPRAHVRVPAAPDRGAETRKRLSRKRLLAQRGRLRRRSICILIPISVYSTFTV
jgi:integration host factor subunit beta